MWCMHTSNQCKVGIKQATKQKNHKKPSSGNSTREQAMASMINIFGIHGKSSDEEWLIVPTWKVPFWFLISFMTSTLVDEYPSLFHQLLFFLVDVSVIVVTYLALIRLIVMSFFGIFDCVFHGWDPSPDQYTPSHRCMLRRCTKQSPQDHRWNHCQKRYNRQWAGARVYPFQIRHFQHQPPDIVLLSAFCIDAGVERWCHKQAWFITTSPITVVINAYRLCVRHQHDTTVFHAYAGTVREARERSTFQY